MFEIFCILIYLADSYIVSVAVSAFVRFLFGNNVLGRALYILSKIGSAIGYFFLLIYVLYSTDNINNIFALAVSLGPVAMFLLLCFIAYIFDVK